MRRALLLLPLLAACGTPGRNTVVDLPDPRRPTTREGVAYEVGRLLSADERASAEAERRLLLLDEGGRKALAAVADTIPTERDPRWLQVLDENQMLPELPASERLAFLLWKAARPDPFVAAKAQNRLIETARSDPDLLIGVLRRRLDPATPAEATAAVQAVAVALALVHERRALPALAALYRSPRAPEDRRTAADAIETLTEGEIRPRRDGAPGEIEREAQRAEAWAREGGTG